jgi:hypothetical protein
MAEVPTLWREELILNKSLRVIKKAQLLQCLSKTSCTTVNKLESNTMPITGHHLCLTMPAKALLISNRIRNLGLKVLPWCLASLLWWASKINNKSSTQLVKALAVLSTELQECASTQAQLIELLLPCKIWIMLGKSFHLTPTRSEKGLSNSNWIKIWLSNLLQLLYKTTAGSKESTSNLVSIIPNSKLLCRKLIEKHSELHNSSAICLKDKAVGLIRVQCLLCSNLALSNQPCQDRRRPLLRQILTVSIQLKTLDFKGQPLNWMPWTKVNSLLLLWPSSRF